MKFRKFVMKLANDMPSMPMLQFITKYSTHSGWNATAISALIIGKTLR
jgi:hypothetical protein